MMNELINAVSQRTGMSPEQAQSAVDAVLNLLKERLPAPIASVLTTMVHGGDASAAAAGADGNGQASGAGLVEEAEEVLGGVFGSKKEVN